VIEPSGILATTLVLEARANGVLASPSSTQPVKVQISTSPREAILEAAPAETGRQAAKARLATVSQGPFAAQYYKPEMAMLLAKDAAERTAS